MLTDGLTDGRTENRTPLSHPATSRCDKKILQELFCKALTCFIMILFLYFKGGNLEEYLKKKKKKIFINFDISQASYFYIF